ncbi:hypothetical protein EV363DRAFT_1584795 [Boletus edulis]|nr:hypothetical protein EV363DRAFT_1584795 [Boletus edulis]
MSPNYRRIARPNPHTCHDHDHRRSQVCRIHCLRKDLGSRFWVVTGRGECGCHYGFAGSISRLWPWVKSWGELWFHRCGKGRPWPGFGCCAAGSCGGRTEVTLALNVERYV